MRPVIEIQQDINSELAFHGLGGYEIQITKVLELMFELSEHIRYLHNSKENNTPQL